MRGLISSSGFRGLAIEQISPEICFAIGLAYGNAVKGTFALGMDTRLSSCLLVQSLASGFSASGSAVLDIGLAPTPAVAFYSKGSAGGAMVTASHNPPPYNGVKLFSGKGSSVTQSFYSELVGRIERTPKKTDYDKLGAIRNGGGIHRYIDAISSSHSFSKTWRVGLDPGNGATTVTAAMAYLNSGCSYSAINVMPDGHFPGRGSEPDGKALQPLSDLVLSKNLEIGFAYDGDGDRFAVVDEKGAPVPQDACLAFTASQMIKQQGGKGTVVVNVDTSAVVDIMVEDAGGKVIRCKVGDVYIVEELLRRRGVFGGETCGAWIFPKLGLCPDGVLSSLAFLSILESSGLKASRVAGSVPKLHLTRKKVPCPNDLKQETIESYRGIAAIDSGSRSISDLDGIRLEFPDKSWVLVRPSGTEPFIRITSEASSLSAAESLTDGALAQIKSIIGEKKRKL